MKIILSLFLSCACAFGATEFDLRKGIDLTGATNVTASQLNQLVDAGQIGSTNKGGIIRRSGNGGSYWPDITLNPRYTNFLWADLFTTPATLKTYVPTGDAYSNWVNIAAASAIANGSVGNAQLAANAVQTTNIADNAVTDAKINAGAITESKYASGSISNRAIADLTIGPGKLYYGAVLSTNIAAAQLLPIHFTTASVNSNALATPAVATTNLYDNSVVSNKVAEGAIGNIHIGGQAVRGSNVVNNTITSNQIALATVNYANIDTNVSYGMFRAWALIDAGGTLLKGFGVSSVSKVGTSDYYFTVGFNASDTNRVILATAFGGNGASLFARVLTNAASGICAVRITDEAAVATASTVSVGVVSY